LRSFVDNVVPLIGRRIWVEGISKWPLFIAFFRTSVNDENDPTGWIDLFCVTFVFDIILESLVDIACDLLVGIEFDDDDESGNNEELDRSDETISANGVHRLFVIDDDIDGAASEGASEFCDNIESG